MSTAESAQAVLMYGVIPLWIAAGVADWACHRSTAIERTSGLPENLLHWLLLAEGGLVLLAVALFEVDAAVLLIAFAGFLAHELTTYLELRYTVEKRQVRPVEQMVHSFMELMPLAILALLALMRWDQVLALFDAGTPDFGLAMKAPAWPPAYLAATGLAVLVLNVLPMVEETVRCVRARGR
jgi:hypothetical protein